MGGREIAENIIVPFIQDQIEMNIYSNFVEFQSVILVSLNFKEKKIRRV